jgi:hypothetical protein
VTPRDDLLNVIVGALEGPAPWASEEDAAAAIVAALREAYWLVPKAYVEEFGGGMIPFDQGYMPEKTRQASNACAQRAGVANFLRYYDTRLEWEGERAAPEA